MTTPEPDDPLARIDAVLEGYTTWDGNSNDAHAYDADALPSHLRHTFALDERGEAQVIRPLDLSAEDRERYDAVARRQGAAQMVAPPGLGVGDVARTITETGDQFRLLGAETQTIAAAIGEFLEQLVGNTFEDDPDIVQVLTEYREYRQARTQDRLSPPYSLAIPALEISTLRNEQLSATEIRLEVTVDEQRYGVRQLLSDNVVVAMGWRDTLREGALQLVRQLCRQVSTLARYERSWAAAVRALDLPAGAHPEQEEVRLRVVAPLDLDGPRSFEGARPSLVVMDEIESVEQERRRHADRALAAKRAARLQRKADREAAAAADPPPIRTPVQEADDFLTVLQAAIDDDPGT